MNTILYIIGIFTLLLIAGVAYFFTFRKIAKKPVSLKVKANNVIVEYSESILVESDFWKLIEFTKKQSNNNKEKQIELLTSILKSKSDKEVLNYGKIYECLYSKSATEQLWALIYTMNGGCGDDSFDYYRSWLISEGKEKFYDLLSDPEILTKKYSSKNELIGFLEDFNYIYSDVTESRNKEDYFDKKYDDYENSCYVVVPEKMFEWEEDLIAVKKHFPNFYEKFSK